MYRDISTDEAAVVLWLQYSLPSMKWILYMSFEARPSTHFSNLRVSLISLALSVYSVYMQWYALLAVSCKIPETQALALNLVFKQIDIVCNCNSRLFCPSVLILSMT